MARLPRLVLPGLPHLVLQRALAGRTAFADNADRQAMLTALREALPAEGVQLHAYALLGSEFRLVLTPPDAAALSRLMQQLGRRYVSHWNRRHGCRGTLWDGRFRCAPLQAGPPCLDAMLWTDGASEQPGATSAAHHTGQQAGAWLTDPPAYWALGNTPFEREAAWRQRLATGLPSARAEALHRAALGGWALGDDAFLAEAATRAGRPVQPRPRGRRPARSAAG
jgi:putative transposase